MEDLTGKQFGPYRITAPLGEGGMAAVYKAYQANMDRYVALKILPRHFASDPQFVSRFEQEAKVLAKFQHPHILPIHDYGEVEGYTYIVMPFITSGPLLNQLRDKDLSLAQIDRIVGQIGDALDYAHSRGIVHRDVKPSNVLVDDRGNCLLVDFGIAKLVEGSANLTGTGGIIGTPAYMSPEQGRGEPVDQRSDIYALGVMLYEMTTGRVPYRAETPLAVLIKHMNDPLPPPRAINPNLPEGVERVILKAMAKQPEDRFVTAGAMVQALSTAIADAVRRGQIADSNTVLSEPDDKHPERPPRPVEAIPVAPPPARQLPRYTWLIGGVGAGVLLLLLAACGYLLLNLEEIFQSVTIAGATPTPTRVLEPSELASLTPSRETEVPGPTEVSEPTLTPEPSASATPTLVADPPTPLFGLPEEDEEVDVTAGLEAADLPIAADAQNVKQDASSEEITYTSPSAITTLADFYRQELTAQSWTEDETFSMVQEIFATLDFEQGEASLTVTMVNDGFSGGTEVTLSGSGLVWSSGDTDTPPPPTATPLPAFAQTVLTFGGEGIGPGLFEDARSIAVEETTGNIYVGEYTGGRIQVFDAKGEFITQWLVDAETPLRGMDVDRQGNVYVVQSGLIYQYNGTDGTLLRELPYSEGWGFDDVVVGPDGGLIAAWYGGEDNIVRFNPNGEPTLTITNAISGQSGDSELNTRVAVDGLGNIYALGTFNTAVFKFGPEGNFLDQFGREGEQALESPMALAVDGQGRVYVSELVGPIKVFDTGGQFLDSINIQGLGLTFDDQGYLYVASRTRVVKYEIEGSEYKTRGKPPKKAPEEQ